MEIGPIWRAMLRNKGGFILIAVQIAVTMTIMVTNVFDVHSDITLLMPIMFANNAKSLPLSVRVMNNRFLWLGW